MGGQMDRSRTQGTNAVRTWVSTKVRGGAWTTARVAAHRPALPVVFLACALALVVLALARIAPEASGQGGGPAVVVDRTVPAPAPLSHSEIEGFWQMVGWGPGPADEVAGEQWVAVRFEQDSEVGAVLSNDGCNTVSTRARRHQEPVEMLPQSGATTLVACAEGHGGDVMVRAHRLETDGDGGLLVFGASATPLARLVRNPGGLGESMPPEWRESERRWAASRTTD